MSGKGLARQFAVALVLSIHGFLLFGIWRWHVNAPPDASEVQPLFAQLVLPPPTPTPAIPVPRPAPRPVATASEPPPLRFTVPAIEAQPATLAATPPAAVESPRPSPSPSPPAGGPFRLPGDLSLACPERTPPIYPATSRRLGEEGRVQLRVELDTDGSVASASILSGSGFERLDNAALSAVRRWRCQPPRRDGQPSRAIAQQGFEFVLNTQ